MAGDDNRSQAIAAAAATLSDSAPPGRSGIVTSTSHSREDLGGQALALGAEAERRDAGRAPRGPRRRARRAPPAAPASRRPGPRRRLAEDRAHARPHRLRREGVGAVGAEHDRAAEQGVRRCGRSRRRCRGRRPRAGRRRAAAAPPPSAAARPRSPACPSRGSRPPPSSSGSTSSPPSPLPAAVSSKRGSAPAARPAASRSSPSVTNSALALAVLALAQLADQLQLLVVGAGDHRLSRLVLSSLEPFLDLLEQKSGP